MHFWPKKFDFSFMYYFQTKHWIPFECVIVIFLGRFEQKKWENKRIFDCEAKIALQAKLCKCVIHALCVSLFFGVENCLWDEYLYYWTLGHFVDAALTLLLFGARFDLIVVITIHFRSLYFPLCLSLSLFSLYSPFRFVVT